MSSSGITFASKGIVRTAVSLSSMRIMVIKRLVDKAF